MKCSSVCEKTRMSMCGGKTQEISFNTLLIKLPFWLEVLALNLVKKTLLMEWEKLAQSPLEILLKNNAQTPKFIGLEKTSRWGSVRPVGRPSSRPANGHISDRCAIGRPAGRPSQDTESSLSVRSTARSTGAFQRAELSGRSTGSVGRPSCQNWLCTSVHVGRPPGRPAEARSENLGI